MNNVFLVIIAVLLVISGTLLFFYNRDVLGVKDEVFFDDCSPINLRITDVTSTSFRTEWATSEDCLGLVKYGESIDSIDYIARDEEKNIMGKNHSVKINNLKPAGVYYVVVVSEGTEYGIDSAPIVVNTKSY